MTDSGDAAMTTESTPPGRGEGVWSQPGDISELQVVESSTNLEFVPTNPDERANWRMDRKLIANQSVELAAWNDEHFYLLCDTSSTLDTDPDDITSHVMVQIPMHALLDVIHQLTNAIRLKDASGAIAVVRVDPKVFSSVELHLRDSDG